MPWTVQVARWAVWLAGRFATAVLERRSQRRGRPWLAEPRRRRRRTWLQKRWEWHSQQPLDLRLPLVRRLLPAVLIGARHCPRGLRLLLRAEPGASASSAAART